MGLLIWLSTDTKDCYDFFSGCVQPINQPKEDKSKKKKKKVKERKEKAKQKQKR